MYTAKVNHNSRKTHRSPEPQVLLTNIYKNNKFFRDHIWVDAQSVKNFIPKHNRYTIKIIFKAKEKTYHSLQDFKPVIKISLIKLNNIRNYK